MAEVLEAVTIDDTGAKQRVALKRIRPQGSERERAAALRMFNDEARVTAQLTHPNLVGMLDYMDIDGEPVQVLELVDGLDARTLLRHAPARDAQLPVGLALHVSAEVAKALAYVHDADDDSGQPLGLVHRDVNPANVLIARSGEVKLADFGIAMSRDREEKTRTGYVKGTVGYMAPEQALGQDVDARSDIFSLGCLLHALLTGRSPTREGDAMLDLLSGAQLELAADLPDDVSSIVEKATCVARRDRYQRADELAQALASASSARLNDDPTELLRSWMSGFDDVDPADVSGRLDALLLPEGLLPEPPSDQAPTETTLVAPTTATDSSNDEGGDSATSAATARRALGPLLGLVAAAVAAGAVAFIQSRGTTVPENPSRIGVPELVSAGSKQPLPPGSLVAEAASALPSAQVASASTSTRRRVLLPAQPRSAPSAASTSTATTKAAAAAASASASNASPFPPSSTDWGF